MADLTGPIDTLPGTLHCPPEKAMCDEHPDRPATRRVQGPTDSIGCEMLDMCDECFADYREEMEAARNAPGDCDWCESKGVKLVPTRDYEEGMTGPVYEVCKPCKKRQTDRIAADLQQYDYYDYDEDDEDKDEDEDDAVEIDDCPDAPNE